MALDRARRAVEATNAAWRASGPLERRRAHRRGVCARGASLCCRSRSVRQRVALPVAVGGAPARRGTHVGQLAARAWGPAAVGGRARRRSTTCAIAWTCASSSHFTGDSVSAWLDTASLASWGAQPPLLTGSGRRAICVGLALANLAALVAGFVFEASSAWLALSIGGSVAFSMVWRTRVHKVIASVNAPARHLPPAGRGARARRVRAGLGAASGLALSPGWRPPATRRRIGSRSSRGSSICSSRGRTRSLRPSRCCCSGARSSRWRSKPGGGAAARRSAGGSRSRRVRGAELAGRLRLRAPRRSLSRAGRASGPLRSKARRWRIRCCLPQRVVPNDVALGADDARAGRHRLEHVGQEHAAARGRRQRRAGAGRRARCARARLRAVAARRRRDAAHPGLAAGRRGRASTPRSRGCGRSSTWRAGRCRCCSCSTRCCAARTRTTAGSAPKASCRGLVDARRDRPGDDARPGAGRDRRRPRRRTRANVHFERHLRRRRDDVRLPHARGRGAEQQRAGADAIDSGWRSIDKEHGNTKTHGNLKASDTQESSVRLCVFVSL